jgi:hypothetical protein
MKKKRLSFNDDFELLYLRHEYMNMVEKKGKVLDPSYVKKYAGIVHTTAKIMYGKLKPNFQKVGFDEEDFIAITNMYMLFYMALYSVQTNDDAMESLLKRRGPQSESEIVRIDRNQMINFLRQRLYHCSVLFARKARSITVGEDKRGFYAETAKSKDVPTDLLLTSYKKHGYRKITLKEFKMAQKNAKNKGLIDLVDKDGHKIIKVEQLNQGLSEYDFQLLSQDDKGGFYNSPDIILQNAEEEVAMEAFKIKFANMDESAKKQMLTTFIENNRGDKKLKVELALARKMLARKTIVV